MHQTPLLLLSKICHILQSLSTFCALHYQKCVYSLIPMPSQYAKHTKGEGLGDLIMSDINVCAWLGIDERGGGSKAGSQGLSHNIIFVQGWSRGQSVCKWHQYYSYLLLWLPAAIQFLIAYSMEMEGEDLLNLAT